jgi:hypothetical protein
MNCHPEPPEARSRNAAESRRTAKDPRLKPGSGGGNAVSSRGSFAVLDPSGVSAAQDDTWSRRCR